VIPLVIYLAGVVTALAVMRDRWPVRLTTALVWPLGPMAFAVVVSMLLVASAILWPVPVLGAAAVIATVIYLIGC
jgi:hypothetical protein